MEEIFKMDGFCNFFQSLFHFIFRFVVSEELFLIILTQSWEDEDTNKNAKSGTFPDLEDQDSIGKFTQYYYCTYGPSFRILFIRFLIFYFLISFSHKTNSIVPFPPTNLQLTQKNSTSVSISWKDDPQSSYYKIVISPVIIPQLLQYKSTSFTLNSLSSSTTYNITIYSGKNNPIGGNETYETVGMIESFYFPLFFSNEHKNNRSINSIQNMSNWFIWFKL